MGKRKKKSSYEDDHTWSVMSIALFGGACGVMTVESTVSDVMESLGYQINKFPEWQLHMGSVCVGIITFFVFLFTLEVFETSSKIIAWRSSAPWLPLVGLTAIATVVHVPFYVVALIGAIYSVWAYRKTDGVRRLTRLP